MCFLLKNQNSKYWKSEIAVLLGMFICLLFVISSKARFLMNFKTFRDFRPNSVCSKATKNRYHSKIFGPITFKLSKRVPNWCLREYAGTAALNPFVSNIISAFWVLASFFDWVITLCVSASEHKKHRGRGSVNLITGRRRLNDETNMESRRELWRTCGDAVGLPQTSAFFIRRSAFLRHIPITS